MRSPGSISPAASKYDILLSFVQLTEENSRFVTSGLVIFLAFQSLRTWLRILLDYSSGKIWLDKDESQRAAWNRFPEKTVLILVLLMIASQLFPMNRDTERTEMTPGALVAYLVFSGGLIALLWGILATSERSILEYGVRFREFASQVRDGCDGFFLAFLPTGILMIATAAIRTTENQNPLLTLLSGADNIGTILGIFFSAVVFAPLYEELAFRVILQGWLTTFLKPIAAISIVAVVFAAVHGLTDGLALLPLAGLLGYVYYRRHSYVAVLVIHGLFNATMLALALLSKQ